MFLKFELTSKENAKLLDMLKKDQEAGQRILQLEQINSELDSSLQKIQTELNEKKAVCRSRLQVKL